MPSAPPSATVTIPNGRTEMPTRLERSGHHGAKTTMLSPEVTGVDEHIEEGCAPRPAVIGDERRRTMEMITPPQGALPPPLSLGNGEE
mmetsp:Transcript_42638/g.129485  ORF Transcript_42638/g.129485 Transcript_42638/m.129485 type:complete len:88 (+) Transcript_42638:985-1248(+)